MERNDSKTRLGCVGRHSYRCSIAGYQLQTHRVKHETDVTAAQHRAALVKLVSAGGRFAAF